MVLCHTSYECVSNAVLPTRLCSGKDRLVCIGIVTPDYLNQEPCTQVKLPRPKLGELKQMH